MVIGRGAAWGALLLMALWAAGRVMNDREVWSQPMWWLPTEAVAAAAWLGLLTSLATEWAGRRLAGTVARPFLLIGAIVVSGWLVVAEWRVPLGLVNASAEGSERICIGYWNASWAEPAGAADRLAAIGADVLVVANPRPGDATRALHEWMHDEAVAWDAQAEGEADHLARLLGSVIISRYAIEATGEATLNLPTTAWSRARNADGQNGLGFATLRLGGSTLTVWVVDLPSDPTLHRELVMAEAARAAEAAGFPAADVIVGDFNTPRGSASLAALTDGLRDARMAAGIGGERTWPEPLPLWAIDLAFVRGSRAIDQSATHAIGAGLHRAISVAVR